jgi:translation initiation factor IF-3
MVRRNKEYYRINQDIQVSEVRLIGDDKSQVGIVSIDEALDYAAERGLDLVEISPKAKPPVCRAMDYGKFIYDKKKKEKEARKKQHKTQLKEIKLSPKIGEHDIEHKRKHAKKFLESGNKVKVSMFFRGRERAFTERGIDIMYKFYEGLEEVSDIEMKPKMINFNMNMFLVPKKTK